MVAALVLFAALSPGTGEDPVDFQREVLPLLASRCYACHGNDEETIAADLRLDRREDAVRDRGGYSAVVPGDPEASELWLRVTDDVDPMPPADHGHALEAGELDVLRRWIEGGADYAPHWAFVVPQRAAPPALTAELAAWCRNPIDAFVAARLAEAGLEPSPEADRATLLRRASLDLTGLPPTPDEVRAFLADDAPDAYERAVDRLLASPHYGERWAAMWLDLARYADSTGHGSDPLRTIWRYRDWVIDAFDKNLPFDEFSTLQLAGDLLPHATTDDRLATAFHRNTMTNTEGGTDDEEFRVLAVKDRVNTTGQVWLGLTVGCAECHSHKYDPLTQREYYGLFDFFNHTADSDKNDDRPRIPTPTPEQEAEHARITGEIAALEARVASFEPDLAAGAERLRREDEQWSVSTHAFEPGEDGRRVDTIRVEASGAVTAVRVRALADAALPGGGPGQSPGNGNFVVTDVEIREQRGRPPFHRARRVRIELPGEARILSLAEVELFDVDGRSLLDGARARQSSTDYDGPADKAIDGNTSGAFEDGSVTHTRTENDPWWEVDLGRTRALGELRIWNRTDGELEDRLAGLVVVLLDDDGDEVWRSAPWPAPDPMLSADLCQGHGLPVRIASATASFEQKGFEVAKSFDRDAQSGWAIGARQGMTHEAVFEVRTSTDFGVSGDQLEVVLRQAYGSDHTLGRVEVATTTLEPAPRARSADVLRALERDSASWTKAERAALRNNLLAQDPEVASLQARARELEQARDSLGVVTTPVMVELTGNARRVSHILQRGDFLSPGEAVEASTPAALHAYREEFPRDRLGLARWLFDERNPLTARVHVNRLWARLFGRGIVATEEDFGAQGELPTHPELLDWLAVEFRENGWDQKALLREIVTSATYRQASDVPAAQAAADPVGALLGRYPRQRLEAEMVRDIALASAGLLSAKKFGPSVFPPQPDGLWQAAFNGQRNWRESMGEDRWRRGVYVFLRRTTPYPMLQTFDAPTREVCTLKRPRTNTPLQAFVTLNDPAFLEAAQALGRAMLAAPYGRDDAARVDHGLWRATQRPPEATHREPLLELLREAREVFADDRGGASAFAGHFETSPLGLLPDGTSPAEAAAWTLVASAALNLDAALTKE